MRRLSRTAHGVRTLVLLALSGCSSESTTGIIPPAGPSPPATSTAPEDAGEDPAPAGTGGSTVQTSTEFGEFFDRSRAGFGGAGGAVSQDGLGSGDLTVLMILDKSGSMTESWGSGSRWEVSLNAFFLGMDGVEDALTIGTLLFPLGEQECNVPPLNAPSQFQYQSGRSFLAAWRAKSASFYPSGATPLGTAFEHANEAILAAQKEGLLGAGRRFRVLVVTDGAPNCATNEERVIQLAADWKNWGVEIHVIGLPGSNEAAQFLARLANPVVSTGSNGYTAPETGEEAEDTFYLVVR